MGRPSGILEFAYRDPRVSRLRHDAENRRTAYQLLTGLIARTNDPEKRSALQAQANEQVMRWGTTIDKYHAALQDAVSQYEIKGTG